MSFWSSETFGSRGQKVVSDFNPENVHHGAYELAIGPEIYLTSSNDESDAQKEMLEKNQTFVVPAGQFALLLTEESVTIPGDAIGFISMRFSIKRRGLINVSGFHVDPGYSNRLKFAVYNAGPSAVTLHRGKRIFMLWLGKLDQETKYVYADHTPDHDTITTEDQDTMRGRVSSPAQLRKELEDLKSKQTQDTDGLRHELTAAIEGLRHQITATLGYRTITIGLLTALLVRSVFSPWTPFLLGNGASQSATPLPPSNGTATQTSQATIRSTDDATSTVIDLPQQDKSAPVNPAPASATVPASGPAPTRDPTPPGASSRRGPAGPPSSRDRGP